MDGKTDWRQKFEKLAKEETGEIVAIVSDNEGETFALDEQYLLEAYEKAITHNRQMPDDLKEGTTHCMGVYLEARAAIQAYKQNHGIPLDTPPVTGNEPTRFDASANDQYYGADILRLDF